MTKYTIVPSASRVSIEARSSLHPIRSDTEGLEGWFEADVLGGGRLNPATRPSGHLELPVDNLSSGNPLYDREMRRRVDARRYPTVAGDLTEMKATEEDGRYQVSGEVTFKGTSNTYADEMLVSFPENGVVHLEGSHVFDIQDFGMQPPKILSFRVYPDVRVTVAIVARSDGGAG